MKRSAWLLLFLIALSGCSSSLPPAAVPVAPVHVVIVGTTDVHGWFDGHIEQVKNTTTRVRYGGFDVLASYVEALRAANGNRVILIETSCSASALRRASPGPTRPNRPSAMSLRMLSAT